MNSPLYFEIQADDVVRAKAFYECVFDWHFTRQEGLPIEYWRIDTKGISGGLFRRPAPIPVGSIGTNAAVISMEVTDFDATARVIMNNEGKVAMAKFAVVGKCWQGYYLDPEGNTFGIFQVDKAAA